MYRKEEEFKKYLLEEYKTAKEGYEENSIKDEVKQNYYKGQIILIEDILDWFFNLHLQFFN